MKVDLSVKPFLGGAEAGEGDGAAGALDINMTSEAVPGGSDLGARISNSMKSIAGAGASAERLLGYSAPKVLINPTSSPKEQARTLPAVIDVGSAAGKGDSTSTVRTRWEGSTDTSESTATRAV